MSVPERWTFFSAGPVPLLPCPIPFELAASDLTPAQQLYGVNDLPQALRFVELCRLSCGSHSIEQWTLRLVAAMLQLEASHPEDAWLTLQAGLSWRNRTDKYATEDSNAGIIQPREWLTMATIALGINDTDAAERYASEAVGQMEKQPACCLTDVLCDTRADAMTVFAAIRLSQQRFQEAEMLLQLSHDAYVQAGDMEQLIGSLALLADVEFHSGSLLAAKFLLYECDEAVRDNCDKTRHFRLARLRLLLKQRLQACRNDNQKRFTDFHLN